MTHFFVTQAKLEFATFSLKVKSSIQLSYWVFCDFTRIQTWNPTGKNRLRYQLRHEAIFVTPMGVEPIFSRFKRAEQSHILLRSEIYVCTRWESNPCTSYESQIKSLVPHAYLGHGYIFSTVQAKIDKSLNF